VFFLNYLLLTGIMRVENIFEECISMSINKLLAPQDGVH